MITFDTLGRKRRLIEGWGVNDANYNITESEILNGKSTITAVCVCYQKWKDIIVKSKSLKFKERNPTYLTVACCEEWQYFSNFRRWVLEEQPNEKWMYCQIDKDLLGNDKLYSPDTCCFISAKVNSFLTDSAKIRGCCMVGVSIKKSLKLKVYGAGCMNPFTGKREHLGYHATELEAHLAWQAKKHEHALRLAEEQEDPRVAKALRERYAPDKDWTKI